MNILNQLPTLLEWGLPDSGGKGKRALTQLYYVVRDHTEFLYTYVYGMYGPWSSAILCRDKKVITYTITIN